MIKIGCDNRMRVVKFVDFGAYLTDASGEDAREILLPARYAPAELMVDDTIDVFIYKDSENRLIATTEQPYARVGEFAFLQVVQVNATGAFMDWGLPTKNLLVPYSEQKVKMRQGGIYPVYVYLDDASQRVVASAKLEKFVGNVFPDYKAGAKVRALVVSHMERGYRCIVDNRHFGMIYENELFRPIELGEELEVRVKYVRPDGKLDLSAGGDTHERVASLADRIMGYLRMNAGRSEGALSDKMAPEKIQALFGCSKKDFKKAVGALYKDKKIEISHPDGRIQALGF
ncbi:MAG: GntR family transcriptional regulator [Muribaculaceae bacterium]|nr:GntR family transcriptional regulator [Muribaculaceae bacterium]